MLRLLFATLLATLLLSAASLADEPLPGPPFTLPEINGFTRDNPIVYDEKGLGYGVNYKREGMMVALYVYNQNRSKIEPGSNSDAVKAEMLDALSAVEANKTTGKFKSIKPMAERVVSFGTEGKKVPFRWKVYEVELKEGTAYTEVYLTAYKDHFVKVRVTYHADKTADHRKALKPLLDALGEALE